eukprot:6208462-Pleurochrysis_carterae.AAC.2
MVLEPALPSPAGGDYNDDMWLAAAPATGGCSLSPWLEVIFLPGTACLAMLTYSCPKLTPLAEVEEQESAAAAVVGWPIE